MESAGFPRRVLPLPQARKEPSQSPARCSNGHRRRKGWTRRQFAAVVPGENGYFPTLPQLRHASYV
jgi:hypothetical protein